MARFQKPHLSVVIPVYNTDLSMLTDCLESVLNQNLDNFEVIAVNDGSPDKLIRPALKQFSEKYPHLKVINQKNAGGAAAINKGIKYARGEYLTIVDHDDIVLAGAFKGLYEAASENNADMATGRLQRLEGKADFWPALRPLFETARVVRNISEEPLLLKNTHYYNWIYKRRFFMKHVGQVPNRIVADFHMMHLMLAQANTVCIVPQTVYLWRRTENSITSSDRFFIDRLQAIKDVVVAHKDHSLEYKMAAFDMYAERLSWYRDRNFHPNNKHLTNLFAQTVYTICSDLKETGADPHEVIDNSNQLSADAQYYFKLCICETEAEAITNLGQHVADLNYQREVELYNAQLHKSSLEEREKFLQMSLPKRMKYRVSKKLGVIKGGMIQNLFPKFPEPFGYVSRLRKKGYRNVLKDAEQRITQSDKAVFFEAFLGKQYGGNPKFIYEYMLEHFPDYEYYWCYHGDPENIPGNATIVRRESKEYWNAIARCGKLVNNITFPTWMYGEEKRYLQTWHGTPLKRLGFDISISGPETQARYGFFNESRNWDGLLCANEYSAQKFKSAFRHNKDYLTFGYPSNDIFYQPKKHDELRAKIRAAFNIDDETNVILYAPTWRDNKQVGNWLFEFDQEPDFSKLLDRVDEKTVVFMRHHHLTKLNKNIRDDNRMIDVSTYPDVHELMVASDVLISDYSSIFFDWACSKKPVLFYTPDFENYASDARGFYLDMEKDLDAQLIRSEDALVTAVVEQSWTSEPWLKQRDTLYEKFCSLHDGHATEKAVDWLMKAPN